MENLRSYNDDFSFIQNIPVVDRQRGDRKKWLFKDVVCAFDIECTNDRESENAFMYMWQFQIGTEVSILGRTWEEYVLFLENLCGYLKDNERLCVYVHNLAYEFAFLKGIFHFTPEEVFLVKARKPLFIRTPQIEYRCSYLQTNMSLEKFTQKMGVAHTKLDGSIFDYKKQRYPWSPLTEYELQYGFNDVIGLVEGIQKEMEQEGDNLYTIPYTSTGYVRRLAKDSLIRLKYRLINNIYPDLDIYKMCREEFRGGDTHASRFYAGTLLKSVDGSHLESFDYSSEYPSIMVCRPFPVTKFVRLGNIDAQTVIRLIYKNKKALLMRIALVNVRLREYSWGFPYIPLAKCRKVDTRKASNTLLDNGRILQADYLEITVNDIDFDIIMEQYTFDNIVFIDVAYANYGKLPSGYINVIMEMFKRKTELKGKEGEVYYYDKAKNRLNALYGMMVQDPVKDRILYDEEDRENLFKEEGLGEQELLDKYKKRAFLVYQWGTWVSAWGRWMLNKLQKIAGEDGVYCDTDSIKGYNLREKMGLWYNECVKLAEENKAFAYNKEGEKFYLGTPELDGVYDTFITWGAKKYAYEDNKGVHITIAGVNKKIGAEELAERGGIEKLQPGFTFRKAGGTEAKYNDFPEEKILREGKELSLTSNVYIRESEYTLGLDDAYSKIIRNYSNIFIDKKSEK